MGSAGEGRNILLKVTMGAAAFMLAATPYSTENTDLVKDIRPGPETSFPNSLTNVGGTLFFSANDGKTGDELWMSDGTEAGTRLVEDIRPGADLSWPQDLTNVDQTLFFDVLGGEASTWMLWRSDGSKPGTRLVKEVDTGRRCRRDCSPQDLTDVDGMLFFTAVGAGTGRELWKSDGTRRGTRVVEDINPGRDDSLSSELTNFRGTLLFSADDGKSGRELWKSDGTKHGTKLVKDINRGPDGSIVVLPSGPFTPVGDTLFFIADDRRTGVELWMTDGTRKGTKLVKDIVPGQDETLAFPYHLTNVGGTLFFTADGGTGVELWKSDGTEGGTELVKDIHPGGSSNPSRLAAVGGTLFFTAAEPTTGYELWKSDGTAAGTKLVDDIYPGPMDSLPDQLTNVGGMLFFIATEPATGPEIWKSDGTEAGTVLLEDVYPGPDNPHPGSHPQPDFALTNVGGTLFFRADDGTNGDELWKSTR